MIRRHLHLLYLIPLLALSACSTNPATGKQSFTAFMSPEKERQVGAAEHPKIIKGYGGDYGEQKLRSYVRHIGKSLAAVSEVPDLPYRFTILNDEKVNAFALPGGYVYITRGLLALADSEAEMAGVLAHEIGHIAARHTAQRYSTEMATNIGLTLLGVLGSAAGVPSGVGQAVSLGAQAAVRSYSREQELEADMLGVRYMTRTGYDPGAMTSFFQKLDAHSRLEARQAGEEGVGHNIMATHPRTADRIQQAAVLAKTTPVANPRKGQLAYLDQIDGMTFGDDPSQGVRRGRVFLHPELRIRFEVPSGFTMQNFPDQVVARDSHKSEIIFDLVDGKSAPQIGALRGYLSRVYGRGLAIENLERLDINGMEAATGQARLNGRDIRLLVIRQDRDRIYRLAIVSLPSETHRRNEDFRRTTFSFRRLSAAEADAIRPLRLSVATVKPGDTPAKFAARMPIEGFRQEWFDVLNGLRPGQRLEPGTPVKIVIE